MPRVYKTVRLAYETKKWLNDLIATHEEQLKGIKESLITKYEDLLRENDEFKNYSPTLSITASSGSLLEAAYNYCMSSNLSPSDWSVISEECKKTAKKEIGDLDVGSTTPRFLIGTDILEGLERLQWELKPANMQRNLQLNFVIKLVVFYYYKHEVLNKR
ncbi:hypothetical protein C5Z25_11500 [Lactobacillus sp. CBA3605]|uniref:hypothetical protein n=1 Tax=Lactobacillus sp. CBA3605 TaxID=2099788 RepID=UPI000CFDC740|nr:hypothetical protein [Lactobacillus sp. CBA3605]AVK62342.1 hypothetical protein C5Z25_11500 [Lactobacillus sp. CBA3605]